MRFFDTNVLVAALMPRHPHHAECNARFSGIGPNTGACAAHSLAEVYNTLTKVTRYAIPPADAVLLIAQMTSLLTVVPLTPTEYIRTLKAAASNDIKGPLIYDALLMESARKADAQWIYTKNVKHFRTVAPDLAARIVDP